MKSNNTIIFFLPLVVMLALISCDPCRNTFCKNGGTCDDGVCVCPEGFSGNSCEIDACDQLDCQNGGYCENGECQCPEGYSGVNCEIVPTVDDSFGEYFEFDYHNPGTPVIDPQIISSSDFITVDIPSAIDDGTNALITFPGIRIQTETHNYTVEEFRISEDGFIWSEPNSSNQFVKTSIASVLVLDMSSSVVSIFTELRQYALDFADDVVNSSDGSKVAVILFAGRNNIYRSPFYESSDVGNLATFIDTNVNHENKTALYEATEDAIQLLASDTFDGDKSILIFTDGGDNDSNNPTSIINAIQASDVNRFTIGLRGADFIENNLSQLSSHSSQHVVAESASDLEDIFRIIGLGVVSVYQLTYERSNQLLSSSEKIRIKVECKSKKIE